MTEIVVATLNVSFSPDETSTNASLKLELDDRETGLNHGDTSFAPGDDVYFFLFKDETVTLLTSTPKSTAGGVTSAGSGTKAVDESITFSNSDTGSLGYPPDANVQLEWVGRCYEIAENSLDPSTPIIKINTDLPEVTGSDLKMAGGKKVMGLLRSTYDSTGSLWKLSQVPKDLTETLLFAVGMT